MARVNKNVKTKHLQTCDFEITDALKCDAVYLSKSILLSAGDTFRYFFRNIIAQNFCLKIY